MTKKALIALFLVMLLSGCASVKSGFVGEEHENIAPFAEVTIEFLGARTVDFRDNELIYLRPYVSSDAPEIKRLRILLRQADGFRDQVIYYSVELVRISETSQSDAAKIEDLADTLNREFREYFLSQVNITPATFNLTIDNIRNQQTFLGALRAVQPLIVTSGEFFEDLLREAEDEAVPDARDLIDRNIQKEFATIIAQLDIIYDRRDELMRGLQMIRKYRLGDKEALRGINDGTIILNRSFRLPTLPNDKQLDATKDYIVSELQQEDLILNLLQKDVDDYLATRAELDREILEVMVGLDIARRQVVGWIRGHQALADGVRDPGKWLKAIFQVAEGAKKVT